MNENEWMADQFEKNRSHLRAVAYRMLGSSYEADDAVQEAWLRLSRADAAGIQNLGGWLTTVVARVCLDMLRSRSARREESLDVPNETQDVASDQDQMSPEHETLISDSVGLALIVVLERLGPAERVAFVLHDMFDVPFDEIGSIVGRSPEATRQLASRARRRVHSAATRSEADIGHQRKIVDAFLSASRDGNFEALLAVLDPEIVITADRAAVELSAAAVSQGAPKLVPEIRGASAVAETFKGRARGAQPALLNGKLGLVWAPGGQTRVAFVLTIAGTRIAAIDLIANQEDIRRLEIEILTE